MKDSKSFSRFLKGWYDSKAHKASGDLVYKHKWLREQFEDHSTKHKGTSWYQFGRQVGELFKRLNGY